MNGLELLITLFNNLQKKNRQIKKKQINKLDIFKYNSCSVGKQLHKLRFIFLLVGMHYTIISLCLPEINFKTQRGIFLTKVIFLPFLYFLHMNISARLSGFAKIKIAQINNIITIFDSL